MSIQLGLFGSECSDCTPKRRCPQCRRAARKARTDKKPVVAWGITYDGDAYVVFCRTSGQAKWAVVKALREARIVTRYEWPSGLSASRAPELDASTLWKGWKGRPTTVFTREQVHNGPSE